MSDVDSDKFFNRFKWEILGDAAFEDIQGLWEPLWLLRGYLKQPDMSEPERQALAERALRELARRWPDLFLPGPAEGESKRCC